jgi:hypothetical protein
LGQAAWVACGVLIISPKAEIKALVHQLKDIVAVLADADPADNGRSTTNWA